MLEITNAYVRDHMIYEHYDLDTTRITSLSYTETNSVLSIVKSVAFRSVEKTGDPIDGSDTVDGLFARTFLNNNV